jgi:hypothetical protein
MIVEVAFPVFMDSGEFPARISRDSSSQELQDYPWDPVEFIVTVAPAEPTVESLTPSQVRMYGGETVQILASGFPPNLQSKNISIHLDSQKCLLFSAPIIDIHGVLIKFITPPLSAGVRVLSITYEYGPDPASTFVATSQLISISDEISLVCEQGCIHGIGRRGTNATLELRSDQQIELPAASEVELSCSVLVVGLQPCTVQILATGTNRKCGALNLEYCIKLFVQYSFEGKNLSRSRTPVLNGYILLGKAGLKKYGVLAMVQFQQPPSVITATFANNWASVLVTFDQNLRTFMWPQCSLLSYLDHLGFGVNCRWSNLQNILIVLGRDASLVPGHYLNFSSGISDIDGLTFTEEPQAIEVQQPYDIQIPALTISGPSTLSQCDIAQIVVTSTSSRNAFFWGCQNDVVLGSILAQNSGPVLNVNGSLLSMGKSYVISVQIKKFYGIS